MDHLAHPPRQGHPLPPASPAHDPPDDALNTPALPPSRPLPRDTCDRRRPQEEDNTRLKKMSSNLVGKAVSPFLKEHIPGLYAPVGKGAIDDAADSRAKDPNTRYCYRHRPDSKCRRAADETKMGFIQRELNSLSVADQEAITHVWSLFSAAPAKHRDLMLQGIITQCCFPQLSTVSREVQEQLKIDFLAALPTELSYKILCHLDTVSLCKAAQVSRRWRNLADDDVVWHRMCEQHIDRKCTKCGWGLPLLEKKKLTAWSQHQSAHHRNDRADAAQDSVQDSADPTTSSPQPANKRSLAACDDGPSKRPKRNPKAALSPRSQLDVERQFRPWKDVYRDRYKVGYNWKTGRCAIKTFKGHENGVTCLQFDDNMLATGSYDTTIKIWNIETGEVMRTLRGHTATVRTLQFDESKLISGSFDKTIKIWNWQTGECLSTLQCHTEGVLSVHYDGCTLASGSIDKTVKIFSFDTKQTFCLRGHTDWVNHVRIDSPSRTVFSASDDMSVKLWDLDSKQCIKTFRGHVGQVQQVLLMPSDFEPDAVPSEDKTDAASVHSSRGGTPTPSCAEAPAVVDSRAALGHGFASDPARPLPPRYMLTGGLDNTVRLWDVETGKCIRSMFGHVEGIWGLVGDTLRVVTGANDSVTKIWEPRSGKCDRSFTGHAGPVTCVGLSDSRMASGSEDGEVRLYSFEGEGAEERGTPS
ncbi:WD domain, G-beta repeat domain-containing protein [Hirsutella rhossiliensis]|uniref:WD domain, g-beta repeat domain-containing protein n=1 Tax=Hirsutella rhossiliensis TaxID=111463 RepID=A0A9P8N396_9HYPO|nr:WD domain, g-beta repeat domain-containing protein [Hirsutella rhossiliensis]KAH0966025.1 WD domain, g-beta repeat domain-containing protein [Hirsutella rhossiliensis]